MTEQSEDSIIFIQDCSLGPPSGPSCDSFQRKKASSGVLIIAWRVTKMSLTAQLIFNQLFNIGFMASEIAFPFLYGKIVNSVVDMITEKSESHLNYYSILYLLVTFAEYVGKYLQKILIYEDTIRDCKIK
jgi:hypothetical protein